MTTVLIVFPIAGIVIISLMLHISHETVKT
jgi:hypothetical protein